MTDAAITDWDDAYDNSGHIPGGATWPDRWVAAAAEFRAASAPDRFRPGLAYGMHPRERLDLFLPEGSPAGLVVFVHGGYWIRFDRDVWSHLAAGPLARGWAVAIPGYPLAPDVRVAAITRSVTGAVEAAAAAIQGPVGLVGHSAGGHLVTRQLCTDSGLRPATRARIRRVVPVSGLHDLRPLMATRLNARLRLDAAEARAESPALLAPLPGTRLIAWVGGEERPEFLRQNALIANIWKGLGAQCSEVTVPGRHHFDVIEALADPASMLVEALVAR